MEWTIFIAFLLGILVGTAYVIFVRYPKHCGFILLDEDEENERSPKVNLRLTVSPEELKNSKYVMFSVGKNYNDYSGKE